MKSVGSEFFILILGSSTAGCSTNNNVLTNKYCGYYFGFNGAAGSAITYNNFVCGNILNRFNSREFGKNDIQ